MSAIDTAAAALGAAGVASVVLATLAGGRWRLGLGMALDLWMGAGLLRLAGVRSWQPILAAAAVVALRHLVGAGLRAGPAADRPAAAV